MPWEVHLVLKRKDLRRAALRVLCNGGECDLEDAMPRLDDAGRDDCGGKQYDAELLNASLQQRVLATAVNARLPL